MCGDDRRRHGDPPGHAAAGGVHSDHGRDDRSWARQQGRAQGDEGRVGGDSVGVGALIGLVGEQLEGHQKQEQPTCHLKGGHGDAQELEDVATEDREQDNDAEGDECGLAGGGGALGGSLPRGQGQKDRDGSQGILDDQERHEGRGEDRGLEDGLHSVFLSPGVRR